jgi:serine/threonine protein kinase
MSSTIIIVVFKLLEDLPIKLSKTNFKFSLKGNLFIVDKETTDSFTIESKNTKNIAKSNKGSLRDSLIDIAEALHFLHSNIKAENILVVSTLKEAIINVKLADFGTARSTTEQVTSKFTRGVGTPIYMAVEVPKNEKYERSANIFCFGVLVWVIMTQEEPYKTFVHSWDVAEFVLQGKSLPVHDEWPAMFEDLITRW